MPKRPVSKEATYDPNKPVLVWGVGKAWRRYVAKQKRAKAALKGRKK